MRFITAVFLVITLAGYSQAAILVFSPNGSYTTKLTLEAARIAADTAGKTVVVTSVLTQTQSNIFGNWSSNRALKFEKGGSIANSTTLTINGVFSAGSYPVFAGSGSIIFGAGSIDGINPDWKSGTDTQQVQWAINTSAASGNLPILISQKYTLDAPVMIDRPVDSSVDYLRFIGVGPNAGFYTASAINMFSSTIAHTNAPVSQRVMFEGIHFSASSQALDCHVLHGDKFLRISFNKCNFQTIRLAHTINFFQDWRFTENFITNWPGVWFHGELTGGSGTILRGGSMPSCHWTDNTWEFSNAAGAIAIKSDGILTGSSYKGNLAENFAGPALDIWQPVGVSIAGNYFEDFVNPAIKFGEGVGAVVLSGNIHTVTSLDPNYYPVDLGQLRNAVSYGNYSDKNLYDEAAMPNVAGNNYGDGFVSIGDFADGNLIYGLRSNHLFFPGTVTGMTAGLTADIEVTKNGNTVTATITGATGTSNSTGMTITGGIPARWMPQAAKTFYVVVLDGNSRKLGQVLVTPTEISFYCATPLAGFAVTGVKGFDDFTISWNISKVSL